jgi:protein phosphatase
MVSIRHGVATDTGNLRQQNEDAYVATDRLIAVADGMGGHNAGEVASSLAVTLLQEHADRSFSSITELVDLVGEINTAIYREATSTTDQRGMGTTLTTAALVADAHVPHVLIANVGDSRTYLLREGELRQITVDHSYVQELVHEGLLTAEEARQHPRRNIVTRALGIDSHVQVDSWTIPIMSGDRFLLCSDGLVDEVPVSDVTTTLGKVRDPQRAARALVELAKASGGRDNITAVVLDVLGVTATTTSPPTATSRRKILAAASAAVVLTLVSILSLWGSAARGGYSVEFEGAGEDAVVVIRKGSTWLWIKPTTEESTDIARRDLLPALETEIDRVPAFSSLDDAQNYVSSIRGIAGG